MLNTHSYRLEDRYTLREGRVFLTGTQALVRILLDQSRRDHAAGLNTAGFVSGYRGSPLGAVDQELWRNKEILEENRIAFLPAINEDLAATAVLGSQQVETRIERNVEGVFALWYGKGPGVDRAGDAIKHGNAYGSSPHGGVLVVAGDDHGCVSSSMPHQSDAAFVAWFMPILNPANIAEYLSFGAYGYALSRFSGAWVGFKAISETVESSASVELPPERHFHLPKLTVPSGGLHYRWPDMPGPQIEERLEAKKNAIYAFAHSNLIDRRIYDLPDAMFGIVTTGKGHLDTMEALRLLGLDEASCRRIGVDIYKVGLVWPLPIHGALEFAANKREILVVEEKRGIIESQLKEYLYDRPGRKPERMVGKYDEHGERLVPWTGELSPRLLAAIIAKRLDGVFPGLDLTRRAAALAPAADRIIEITGAARTPYFCSGCPHNTSTKVPEGSEAQAGIGCHFMATGMDRNTNSVVQMGGEGVNWTALSRFTGNGHIFQNLGEGTYYHSGSLAIRQTIAAKVNITYKILYNDAVAMTGGQPVDGPLTVQAIAHEVRAEGVERIAIVSDNPDQLSLSEFPARVTLHDRRDLDAIQRELRTVPGVSVLIYVQMCATEKRKRRKRGLLPKPTTTVMINDLVCEGCGDCSVESNCLSVEPLETPFGRKRKINQSSCNADLSCLNGFCPSFVTLEGNAKRKAEEIQLDVLSLASSLPDPVLPSTERAYNLLVLGVGGTGVVTVGALVAMGAHLDKSGVSVLDFMGFAQKFGPVLSYLRIGDSPDQVAQPRIDAGAVDAVVVCDLVVGSSPKASSTYRAGMSVALNTAEMPTSDFVRRRDANLSADRRADEISVIAGIDHTYKLNANGLADRLFGDTVLANVIMLGFAWQRGLVPVSLPSIVRAIELNGVATEANLRAFAVGRLACVSPEIFSEKPKSDWVKTESNDQIIERRVAFLTKYQDEKYAEKYRDQIEKVRRLEDSLGSVELTTAVARSLFKLVAYKDEYEVARLHLDTRFTKSLKDMFVGDYKIKYHLAPPLLPLGKDARGRPRKITIGAWVSIVFRVLTHMRHLRGTTFDVFGYSRERRQERALVRWYVAILDQLVAATNVDNVAIASKIAEMPLEIRGFGPVKEEAITQVKQAMIKELSGLV